MEVITGCMCVGKAGVGNVSARELKGSAEEGYILVYNFRKNSSTAILTAVGQWMWTPGSEDIKNKEVMETLGQECWVGCPQ